MNYGYIRVSTEEQNLENQKKAISELYHIDQWIEEKKSGTIAYQKRNLGKLMNILTENDTLIVTEISRLGRSLVMIFDIISKLSEKGVRVIGIKNDFDLNPRNKNQIVSQVLLFAFGLSAQIERDLISERTKLGLDVARSKGKRIGRIKGEKIYNVKLRPYEKDIIKKYKKGISVNAISVEYGVSWLTVKNFLTKYVGEKEEEIKEHNKRNFRNSKRRKSYKEKMNK